MEIRELKKEEFEEFKSGIQGAFQKGYEDYYGKCEKVVIPDKDIVESYTAEGSYSFVAVENDEIIGGAIVVINDKTNRNHLDILYVKPDVQSKGVGFALWKDMEERFPNTLVWKTCTPYFDKRNINFYINKCGFHIVKFYNEYYPDPHSSEDFIGDAGEGLFEFEKIMQGK